MKNSPILLAAACLALAALAGCGGPTDESAPVTTQAKPAPVTDPAKQALLPRMSEVARTQPTGWASLAPDLRAPFLEFHDNDEARAKTHYETLVETEREIQQNLAR